MMTMMMTMIHSLLAALFLAQRLVISERYGDTKVDTSKSAMQNKSKE